MTGLKVFLAYPDGCEFYFYQAFYTWRFLPDSAKICYEVYHSCLLTTALRRDDKAFYIRRVSIKFLSVQLMVKSNKFTFLV